VCVEAKALDNLANRCCNPNPSIIHDSRCVRGGALRPVALRPVELAAVELAAVELAAVALAAPPVHPGRPAHPTPSTGGG